MANVYGSAGVAVDTAGNIYFTDNSNGHGRVVKWTPSGGQTILPFNWLTIPYGVTVDGSGNVYVTDYFYEKAWGLCLVWRLSPAGVQTRIWIPELRNPSDVHVDTAGNLYVVDRANNRIVRVAPDGTQETILPGNLDFPFGIYVDSAGTITVSNSMERAGTIRRDVAGNETKLPFTEVDGPTGLDIDSAGNVYLVQSGAFGTYGARVLKMTPDGVQSVVPFPKNALRDPKGIAVTDKAIFVAGEHGIARLDL
ncbi:hypothetical protein ACFWF7_16385 [Nocardia sp. NPDC060256]|uniref:hypothetical protein n=1 Tax=unclassified Nocardia TaxID=2637762 RepID=UPI00365D28FD